VKTEVAKAVELIKSGAYFSNRSAEVLNGRSVFASMSNNPNRYASLPIISGAII
jgi:hypothetical protein